MPKDNSIRNNNRKNMRTGLKLEVVTGEEVGWGQGKEENTMTMVSRSGPLGG